MSKSKKTKPYRLLVVSHPDDETLFFSAAILNQNSLPWIVVCVTNGNADGLGAERARQFQAACKKLKIKEAIQLDFPDIFEKRLDIERLIQKLQALPKPAEVYTHGIVGEYGHPHHQDVSYAVHKAFPKQKVWVPAYNCFADKKFALSQSQYNLKSSIYSEIYQGETLRFAQMLPNRSVDEFALLEFSEVQEVYASIIEKRAPDKAKLKKYKWFYAFLASHNLTETKRPF